MINSTLNVKSGAILLIDSANVAVSDSSKLNFERGSTLYFESDSLLSLESGCSIDFDNLPEIVVEINDVTGEFVVNFLYFENSSDASDSLEALELLNESGKISVSIDDADLSDDEWFLVQNDNYLSITNIVAVPEPSTYAMIFGALALGLAVYRRRK